MGAEGVVGIDGYRVVDHAQQRQVVVRVAVEVAAFKGAVVLQQPAFQASYLALTETRDVRGLARVAAILAFAFGRQQQVDAEMAGYRAGDEAVGRGDDHQGVAGLTVTLDQGQRLGQHDGQDFLLHELLVPGVKLFGRMLAEQLQAEIQVDPDIQSPGQIVVEKLVVTRLVLVRINNPMGNDKLAPGVIAVPAQQGVVEVEDGE